MGKRGRDPEGGEVVRAGLQGQECIASIRLDGEFRSSLGVATEVTRECKET